MSDKTCIAYAAWNRASLLRASLERLSELTVPDEVIVVDDGSVDETEGVCSDARDQLGLPIRHLYNHRPYEAMCSQAKNCAIKATDADVMIFSEPECRFETDVVSQLLAAHAEDQQWGTLRTMNVGTINHGQAPGTTCRCGCGGEYHVTRNYQAYFVCLFRRDWLLSVNGWDEQFPSSWGWDDTDLGTRLRISGIGQHNLMDAVAIHQWHPSRLCDQRPNEQHFAAKAFHGDERSDHPELAANQGHEWGLLVSR